MLLNYIKGENKVSNHGPIQNILQNKNTRKDYHSPCAFISKFLYIHYPI